MQRLDYLHSPSTERSYRIVTGDGAEFFVDPELMATISPFFEQVCASQQFLEARKQELCLDYFSGDDIELLLSRCYMETKQRNWIAYPYTKQNVGRLLYLGIYFGVDVIVQDIQQQVSEFALNYRICAEPFVLEVLKVAEAHSQIPILRSIYDWLKFRGWDVEATIATGQATPVHDTTPRQQPNYYTFPKFGTIFA